MILCKGKTTISLIALVSLFGLQPCASQERQTERKQRLVVADCIEVGLRSAGEAARMATIYLYEKLAEYEKYEVVSQKELLNTARRLRRVSSNVTDEEIELNRLDRLIIACELNAEAIVESRIHTDFAPDCENKIRIHLEVKIYHVAGYDCINGAFVSAFNRGFRNAIEETAETAAMMVTSRQLVVATVQARTQKTVALNRGLRDGIKVGDELVVSREGSSYHKRLGQIRVIATTATTSEALVTDEVGTIHTGDIARVLYRPRFLIPCP